MTCDPDSDPSIEIRNKESPEMCVCVWGGGGVTEREEKIGILN